MEDFITRLRDSWENQGCFNTEPLHFKILSLFLMFLYGIYKFLKALILSVTCPIWVPIYTIIYFIKYRKE